MVTVKCLIIDDEPLAREVLQEYIAVIDYLELVGTAENALELDQLLGQQAVDLIFLDIQMPYMTGFDFLKVKEQLPMVVITTAYPDYALEGFRFNVMDYLLKPITFNRFFKAADKAYKYHILKHGEGQTRVIETEPPYFFVKCENRYQKIVSQTILFIQALQNYVVIQTEKERYMTLMPLKTVEENLDASSFIRVHKSYVVAIPKIESLENHELMVTGGFQIPVSRNYRTAVAEKVLKNKVLGKSNNLK